MREAQSTRVYVQHCFVNLHLHCLYNTEPTVAVIATDINGGQNRQMSYHLVRSCVANDVGCVSETCRIFVVESILTRLMADLLQVWRTKVSCVSTEVFLWWKTHSPTK